MSVRNTISDVDSGRSDNNLSYHSNGSTFAQYFQVQSRTIVYENEVRLTRTYLRTHADATPLRIGSR